MPSPHESVETAIDQKYSLEESIQKAKNLILSQQTPEGYWWYTLQANETIGSGYIMLSHLLDCVEPATEAALCRRLLDEQLGDGSWNLYYGADGDISTTVEAYLALRLAGYDQDYEALSRARSFILKNGGLTAIRIFSRIHLALFGLIPWKACPSMPVWLIQMPLWSRFSVYEFSSWARASIVPLLIVMEKKPVKRSPFTLDELSESPPTQKDWKLSPKSTGFTWDQFFIMTDRTLKLFDKIPWHPGKKRALDACETWVRKHLHKTEDIYPALAYGAMSLWALGYGLDDPQLKKAIHALHRFQQLYTGDLSPDSDTICRNHPLENHPSSQTLAHPVDLESIRVHQQCCISPLWDTPWNVTALLAAGLDKSDPPLKKAVRYLLRNQIKNFKGDWSIKNPHGVAGGWAFEFENDYYPDVDDTIQILNVIGQVDLPVQEKKFALQRGLDWLYSMQSDNGGWAAFDINNTANWVNRILFSDHGACLDPPTADITGRMIGLLADLSITQEAPIIQKALHFIEQDQHLSNDLSLKVYRQQKELSYPATEKYGAWWGRWGVNYIYGTWCVLCGLSQIGIPTETPIIKRSIQWLKDIQLKDGGWGESCHGYRMNHFIPLNKGVPSQTAWALMALISSGEAKSEAVCRGIDFLKSRQRPDGGWDENEHTGTGFPGHFYLRYHGYHHYFPLMALGKYQNAIKILNLEFSAKG